MSERFTFRLASLAALCALPACTNAMVASFNNASRMPAANPISGETISWSKPNKNVPFEGPGACSVWPIESKGTIHATATEICIDAQTSELETMSHSDNERSVAFAADPAGDGISASSAPTMPIPQGRVAGVSRKVGSCYSPSTHRASDVWLTTYSGCVPNKTAAGAPLLTERSTFLDVNGVGSWKFDRRQLAAR